MANILAGAALLGLPIGFFIWLTNHRVSASVKGTVDRLLDQKIKGPALVNYRGFLIAVLADAEGREVERLEAGTSCNLSVCFAPEPGSRPNAAAVNISGGEDAPEVVFKVVIDSDDFVVTPDRNQPSGTSYKMVSVPAKGTAKVAFALTAPEEAGEHSLFVQLFQKTRLIQIVTLTLAINERAEA
jgi:hypothetical protein